MGSQVIVARGLGKRYLSGGQQFWVFRGLCLEVEAGEMVCVWGPSGSGKTTLLSLLAGLERPTEGTVHLSGVRVSHLSEARSADLRRRHLGFVFQFFYLLPNLTAVENIALPLVLAGQSAVALPRARALARRLGLGDRCASYPAQLSGGEQQRVAIGRALINEPTVLMADEPAGNLDAASATVVLDILRGQTAEGRAVLVASHNTRIADLADRVVDLGVS
ncbi:MAG: ABC transporter ATP-binding protein [bacterium]|nr:ABC transporter ATP-binding protein [bacterium]